MCFTLRGGEQLFCWALRITLWLVLIDLTSQQCCEYESVPSSNMHVKYIQPIKTLTSTNESHHTW